MMQVFADKDEEVRDTVMKFMHGYVTWHLCDPRYKMAKLCELAGDDETGRKFRQYFEDATKVGCVDPALWALRADPVAEQPEDRI